jgi:hypothetical protein
MHCEALVESVGYFRGVTRRPCGWIKTYLIYSKLSKVMYINCMEE